MHPREIEIKNKWGALPSKSDEDLKKIAKDIYNGLIFTDRHCGNSDVSMVFMVLMFMGPKAPEKPKHPNDPTSLENSRDNAIYDVIQRDIDQSKWEEDMKWYHKECEYYEKEQLNSIGLVYEYLSEAGPMAVNGKPTFFSLRLLNKVDTEKMFEYYEQYKKIRETADIFNLMAKRQWRSNDYHGQTRIEFEKNYKRVRDIVDKSLGDLEKQTKLAKVQADRITDEYKALNRARAAEELGHEEIFEVFFRRAYELGSVSTVSYRDYVLSKLID